MKIISYLALGPLDTDDRSSLDMSSYSYDWSGVLPAQLTLDAFTYVFLLLKSFQ